MFARHIARRRGPLLDRPHRLPRQPIEDKHQALLRELHDGLHRAPTGLNRDDAGRRGQVVVPQAVMDRLEVPFADARRRVQAHDRLGEEVPAGSRASVEVVARRADGQVEQASRLVERHGRPDVGMARDFPRVVAPRLDAELPSLRHRVERGGAPRQRPLPQLAARRAVDGVPIRHAVADDDEIPEDDGRRRAGELLRIDFPLEIRHEADRPVGAERCHRLAGAPVEADQPVAAVDEDAQLAPLTGIAPGGDAAMDEPRTVGHLAGFVRARVVRPQLAAVLRVERHDAVVGRTDVQHVVDHQGRVLERSRLGAKLGQRFFAGLPRPRHLERRDILAVDVGRRGPLRPGLVAAVERPLDHAGLPCGRSNGVRGRATGHGADEPGDQGNAASGQRAHGAYINIAEIWPRARPGARIPTSLRQLRRLVRGHTRSARCW